MATLAGVSVILRRLAAEWAAGALLFALVLVTAFVFAAAPRLFNRLADEGLRHEVAAASSVERDIEVSEVSRLEAGSGGALDGVEARGEELQSTLPASVDRLIADRSYVVESVQYIVLQPPDQPTFVTLRYQSGIDAHVRYVAGRAPTGAVTESEIPGIGTPDGHAVKGDVFEAALSSLSAEAIGVTVGDRLFMTPDRTQQGASSGLGGVAAGIKIVGIFEATEPRAEYWLGDTSLQRPSIEPVSLDTRLVFATALFASDAYPVVLRSTFGMHYTWRYFLDPERWDTGDLDSLLGDLRRMQTTRSAVGASQLGQEPTLRTGLSAIADRYLAQRRSSESLLTLAAVGPASVATGAVALVGMMLVRRRRAQLALARGRGASASQILAAQLGESLVLVIVPALLGYIAASSVISARASQLSVLVALGVAAIAIVLLLAATLPSALAAPDAREREEAGATRLSPRRLVFEGLVLVLAVAGTFLLRSRGLAARTASGGEVGIDPFLTAVPLLLGLVVGLATLRLYPLPVRVLAWVAALRRDLVPVFALRRVGRQSPLAHLPLLVLLATVAITGFSTVMLVTIERGQTDASWQRIGANFRVPPDLSGSLGGIGVEHAPGVQAVARWYEDRKPEFTLYAIETDAYTLVSGGTPADPHWPGAFLAAPPAGGAGPIPAIVSRDRGHSRGDRFELAVGGKPFKLETVEVRSIFPGLASGASFVIVPLDALAATLGRALPATALLVRAPDDDGPALRAFLAERAPGVGLDSRPDLFARMHDAPLIAAVSRGFALAVGLAIGYAALALTVALTLTALGRRRQLAQLRTMGLGRRQALGLTLAEHIPELLVAFLVGTALGVAAAWLVLPALSLSTFVGSDRPVALRVDWVRIGLYGAAPLAVAAAGIVIGAWIGWRGNLGTATRVEIE
jgi:putative ABC transport system permease protein